MNLYHRSFAILTALLVLNTACSEPAGPAISDVDTARAAWLRTSPDDYTFEIASASSWFPRSGYYRVVVEDREVVSVTAPDGSTFHLAITIDELWERILAARAANQLHRAQFSANGVPLDVDYGPWEVDGGVRYWIRNFRAS
jgi:hypothetical protein